MTDSEQRRFAWFRPRIFLACWILYCGYYLCRKNLSVAPPLIPHPRDLANLLVVFGSAYALAQFVAGWAVDRWGGRPVAFFGALLSSACCLGIAVGSSGPMLLVLLVGNGLGQGCGWPAMCRVIATWFCRRERGMVIAWFSSCYSLGGFVATALATWLVSTSWLFPELGWKRGMIIPALLLAGAALYWQLRAASEPAMAGLPALREDGDAEPIVAARLLRTVDVLRNQDLQVLACMYFFLKLTRYALLFWLPSYLVQNLQYSEHFAGYTASFFELIGFAGALGATWISDRYFGQRRYPVGASMMFALAFVCLLHPVFSRLGWLATATSISVTGILIYGADVLMSCTAALEAVPPEAYGRAAGFVNGTGSIGQVLSPFIVAGVAARFGWDSLFNLFVTCAAVSGVLLALQWNRGAADANAEARALVSDSG